VADDQVVEDLDVQQLAGGDDFARYRDILGRGRGV